MPESKILTHSGSVHLDDYLSVCFVVAHLDRLKMGTIEVQRVDSITKQDLEDPHTWVLDIGRKHDPERHNFDHHQLDPELRECAFSLLIKHFELENWAKLACPWYDRLRIVDNIGVYRFAEERSVSFDVLNEMISPCQSLDFSEFASAPNNDQRRLCKTGNFLYRNITKLGDQFDFFDRCATFETDHTIIWFDKNEDRNVARSQLQWLKHKGYPQPQITVSPDTRSGGWAIFVFHEHQKEINLTKVQSNPAVTFCHASGFLCVVKKETTKKEIRQLIQTSRSE